MVRLTGCMSERNPVFRTMAIGFAVSAVPAILALAAVLFGLGAGALAWVEVVTLGVAIGCLVASFTALATTFSLSATATAIFADEPESRRPVTRVVARGKEEPLTPSQRELAARYARHLSSAIPVQFAQSFLVIVAVSLIQVPNLVRGETEPLFVAVAGVIAVCLVGASALTWIQLRLVRAYARAHRA